MLTFDEAIEKRGIDEKKAIKSFKLSRAAERRKDRKKLFAGSLGTGEYLTHNERVDLDSLTWQTDPKKYAEAWCRANHLKP